MADDTVQPQDETTAPAPVAEATPEATPAPAPVEEAPAPVAEATPEAPAPVEAPKPKKSKKAEKAEEPEQETEVEEVATEEAPAQCAVETIQRPGRHQMYSHAPVEHGKRHKV
jgi:hypothetical protein